MTGYLIGGHQVYELPALLSWQVLHTASVPCDRYGVTFPYDASMAKALHLTAGFAAYEDGQVVLRATVDEYTVDLGSEGLTATVHGRGYAARLLDNESRPATYQSATLEEIVRRHVTPYGISCGELAQVRADSVYTVPAGVSQWRALEDFCQTYGGFSPRFSREGKLLAAPERDTGRLVEIGDDAPVLGCTLREDHYGVLTEVLVIDKTQNTSYTVRNQDMMDRGGQCRRVVYTPGSSTWAAMRYTGEYQIARSREGERQVTLTLPGIFPAFPGDRARLALSRLGLFGDYRVAEAESRFSADGGGTVVLTLKERG